MKRHFHVLLAFILLGISVLACGLPGAGNQPPALEEPSAPDQVSTVVASTLQALTPNSPNPPAGETPQSPAGLLPHSLYFINNDNAGIPQVFRLEPDGRTLGQVTFEPTDVQSYDVSQVDGRVAYVTNNQLLLIGADGSGRRVLVDGGPIDPNNPFINSIRLPAFSPDGLTIAYGYKGLNFFAVATGVSNRVLDDAVDDLGNNLLVVREAYSPDKYSADGTKLLLTLHYYEGGSAAIYYPAANSLVRLSNEQGALICCGEPEWTPDGSAVFTANPSLGMFSPGLWRVDAANGSVTTLLGGESNFADEPYLAPDNQLYYFYSSQPGTPETANRSPLQLVRSAADGNTNRTLLIPDSFLLLNEALWAPDASLVIVAIAPIAEVYQGGLIELHYTDGIRGMVPLLDYGQQLKWGP
jgi:predicted small lipoprotein YifL